MNIKRQKLLQEFFETLGCLKRSIQAGRPLPFDGCMLSKAQLDILLYLAHQKEGSSVKDLAEYLHVTSGAITQLVDGLVEKKLVQRIEKESDRRIQILTLSEKAREALDIYKKGHFLEIAPMFEDMSDEEIKTMISLLNKIDTSKKKGGENK